MLDLLYSNNHLGTGATLFMAVVSKHLAELNMSRATHQHVDDIEILEKALDHDGFKASEQDVDNFRQPDNSLKVDSTDGNVISYPWLHQK